MTIILNLLYYMLPPFSTVFLHHIDGQCQKGQPNSPGGCGGDGERLVEIQVGDGFRLFRQIKGGRAAQRDRPKQQSGQKGGDSAMEQLACYIGPDGQAAVPQEGQYLAVYRYSGPAQHEGRHRQPPGQGPVSKGGYPGGHLHQSGEQPLRPGLVHSQGGQEGRQQVGRCGQYPGVGQNPQENGKK